MNHRIKKWIITTAAIAVSLTGIRGLSYSQDIPINEKAAVGKEAGRAPIKKKEVKGVVVDMLTGEPVAGAKVALLKDSATTGMDGRFVIKDVDEQHDVQISIRITTDLDIIIGCTYFALPVSYYSISASKEQKLDVQIVDMLKDDEVVLRIADYSTDNIDKYCQTCHESSPCLTEEDIGRPKDKIGKQLRGILVRQSKLEEYIKQMKSEKITLDKYKNLRYRDTHPKGMDITATVGFEENRIQLPEGLILKGGKILTCDTCHTRHTPTQWAQFVVGDFEQKDSICIKCHK